MARALTTTAQLIDAGLAGAADAPALAEVAHGFKLCMSPEMALAAPASGDGGRGNSCRMPPD
ncbi:MAG: hypothetical protein ACK4RN_13925 [Pseudorhodobacter sp.]